MKFTSPPKVPQARLDLENKAIADWLAGSENLARLRGRLGALENREIPEARTTLEVARRDPARLAADAAELVVGGPAVVTDLPALDKLEATLKHLEDERRKVKAAIPAQERANHALRVAASREASLRLHPIYKAALRDVLEKARAYEAARVYAASIPAELERFDLAPIEPLTIVHAEAFGREDDPHGGSRLCKLARELREAHYID